jgi:hypothetical protein
LNIKSNSKYLYFTFISGITKLTPSTVLSGFDSLTDVSMDEDFGSLVGFTQEELTDNFAAHMEAAAKERGLTPAAMAEEVKNYYYGFCFDGKTKLYNPYSAVHFFDRNDKYVFPSWMTSGSTQAIKDMLAEWKVLPNYFQGQVIDRNTAEFPGPIEENNSTLFLYQTGYLSIREKRGQICILDYPNTEVLQFMNRLFLDNCFRSAADGFKHTDGIRIKLRNAFKAGNWTEFIKVLNRCLMAVNYPQLPQEIRSFLDQPPVRNDSAETGVNVENNISLVRPTEYFFQNIFRIFFISAKLPTDIVRVNNSHRGAVVVFQETDKNNQPIIIETNIIGDQESAQMAAERGFQEILDRSYGEQFPEPILISLTIDSKRRKIIAGISLQPGL